MSRLLQPVDPAGFRDGTNPPDGFVSRIAKFIPSESGTLFTIVNAYLLQRADELSAGKKHTLDTVVLWDISLLWWSVVVIVVCFIGNFILLNRLFEKEFINSPVKKELKRKHITASSFAFVIWAYSIRSPLFENIYEPFIAILGIGFFLIVCWQIKPPTTTS